MGMSIREVMTPSPKTLEAGSSAAEAAELMKEVDVGMIPVIQEGRLLGTLTDRDLALVTSETSARPSG